MNNFAEILTAVFDRHAEARIADAQEERRAIADAQAGDSDATVALVLAYAPVLRAAVGQYRYAGGLWEGNARDPHRSDDLRSSAVMGLLEAVHAFDPEKHDRLAGIVHGYVADAVSKDFVGPVAFTVPKRTLTRFYSIFEKAGRDVVKGAEIAREHHMSPEVFLDVLAAVRAADVDLDDDQGLAAWEAARPAWHREDTDAEDAILVEAAFEAVDDVEAGVVRTAYGFEDYGDPQTDAEVAHRHGLSRPKAQRVRSGALGKMRTALGVTTSAA